MAEFDVRALSSLRHRHGRVFQSQNTIFIEAESGTELYIILSGAVHIVKHVSDPDGQSREVVLARLGPGSFFGEMGAFTGKPRSATAIATAQTVVLCFDRQTILQLIQANPRFAITIIQSLCDRINVLDEWVSSAGRT